MGRFLDFVFNRFFLGMIATAFFWLLTLAGGIILGLAPASATLMSLYAEHGYSFREYSLKEAWSLYKQNFVSSNLIFYSFLGVGLVLTYGSLSQVHCLWFQDRSRVREYEDSQVYLATAGRKLFRAWC